MPEPPKPTNVKKSISDPEIDKQLSNNKIVLNFIRVFTPKILIQIKTEWKKLRDKNVTGSRLPALLGIIGKSKFEDYWNSISRFNRKKYNQDRLFKFLKRSPVRKSNLAYFNKETKCNAKKCNYFSYKKIVFSVLIQMN